MCPTAKCAAILLCLAVCYGCVLSAIPAGIYVDNGFDQTEIERALTRQEKREMELEILHLLGLPSRPKRGVNGPLTKSASKFLLDVYKNLMDKENSREERSVDLNLSGEDEKAIDESDVIMTFESTNHHLSAVRHERGKRLWFNMTNVPVENTIVGAELRLYQNINFNTNNTQPDRDYTVTAYQLITSPEGERELEYVGAINTTAGYSGWLELNITAPLATWIAFPDSNKGLYLSVHPINRPGHEVRPEDIGLVINKGEDEYQPFMVAFLKTPTNVKVRATRAIRRVKKSEYTSIMKSSVQPKHGKRSASPEHRTCKINNLYISFKDLKWQDWIIAPPGYAAYYCSGECNFPLNSHMNATNHAIVQTLVHLISSVRYPKPCCAPTKLTPISVLYFADSTNVALKKYKKMVVKSCGCH
ncbi:TGF-beta propeptide [Popillia japonica]|uniref:TGF-beta propeptide n=1 Tax=Popillia japonica TaxID=7064 RepID=A0AAW1KP33_POPJA